MAIVFAITEPERSLDKEAFPTGVPLQPSSYDILIFAGIRMACMDTQILFLSYIYNYVHQVA